jgi:hypothetical protein
MGPMGNADRMECIGRPEGGKPPLFARTIGSGALGAVKAPMPPGKRPTGGVGVGGQVVPARDCRGST